MKKKILSPYPPLNSESAFYTPLNSESARLRENISLEEKKRPYLEYCRLLGCHCRKHHIEKIEATQVLMSRQIDMTKLVLLGLSK